MPDGRLDLAARRRALEAATAGELDLLVIGGGITGILLGFLLARMPQR